MNIKPEVCVHRVPCVQQRKKKKESRQKDRTRVGVGKGRATWKWKVCLDLPQLLRVGV